MLHLIMEEINLLYQNGIKDRKNIIDAAVSKHRRLLKLYCGSNRHNKVYVRLYNKFLAARSKGMKVSFSYLLTHANKIKDS